MTRKLSHPWRSALATFAAITITGPFLGTAGVSAWIMQGSASRIAECVKTQTRETCEDQNRWDSVSLANLVAYTFGGWVYSSLVLGVVGGWLSFRAAQPQIVRQIPPKTRARLEVALSNGLNLEEVLDIYQPGNPTK